MKGFEVRYYEKTARPKQLVDEAMAVETGGCAGGPKQQAKQKGRFMLLGKGRERFMDGLARDELRRRLGRKIMRKDVVGKILDKFKVTPNKNSYD